MPKLYKIITFQIKGNKNFNYGCNNGLIASIFLIINHGCNFKIIFFHYQNRNVFASECHTQNGLGCASCIVFHHCEYLHAPHRHKRTHTCVLFVYQRFMTLRSTCRHSMLLDSINYGCNFQLLFCHYQRCNYYIATIGV